MNASDFGVHDDIHVNRGVCMWAMDKEWCGTPLVTTDYRGNFNPPDGYKYGRLYGIYVPEGMPEVNAMWICNDHSNAFLNLNGKGEGVEVWKMNYAGVGEKMSPRFVMHDCPNCGGHEEPWSK